MDIGYLSLVLAFIFGAYAMIVTPLGARRNVVALIRSGENAVHATAIFVTSAVVGLVAHLVSSNMHLEYVANYSSRALPIFYKFTALWAGQSGSLLLWGWILVLYSSLVVAQNRNKEEQLMPYVVPVLMSVALFFIALNLWVANPFARLWHSAAGKVVAALNQPAGYMPFIPRDGNGLNPMLQHPAMAIHPPMLYLGYVGFAVPFAFAMAALFTRKLDNTWIKRIRRWVLVPWLFLGVGIILGGKWAYMELGWGGYWAWDPVENASLMPWLAATAFLHSIMIQEKKNMLKVWNMSLIILTFSLCIFGTFITRSGIISSVHTFTESAIGPLFFGYVVVVLIASFGLLINRLPFLRTENQIDSFVSREATFLLNNLVLLGAAFAVLWGTMFPVISEAVRGVKITVGPPFFNQVNVPIGLILLFLTGFGPVVAWRRTSTQAMKRLFLKPTLAGAVVVVILLFLGVRHFYALVSIGLSAFVVGTIVSEFHRGARARQSSAGENYVGALYRLLRRNQRRYGGYIIHLAMVMVIIGITGTAFNKEYEANLQEGQSAQAGPYTIVFNDAVNEPGKHHDTLKLNVSLFKGERLVKEMDPQRHFYHSQEQMTTEVALHSTLAHDVYMVIAGYDEKEGVASLKVYLNPLVTWIWIGALVMVLGGVLVLIPPARGKAAPASSAKSSKKKPATTSARK